MSQVLFYDILSVLETSEQFAVAFVYFIVSLYITAKKAFCVWSNNRVIQNYFFYLLKVIATVDLPTPLLQEPYIY